MTYVDPLVGKFILIEAVRTAVVEAPLGVGYFLIRFDDTGAPAPGRSRSSISPSSPAASVPMVIRLGWLCFDSR